jgi:hypothetical protein
MTDAERAFEALTRMYGPMTRRTRAGLFDDEPSMRKGYLPTAAEQATDSLFAYGPMPAQFATELAMQPVRAGEAIGNAAFDPSVGKVTNAGVQTAMTFMQPVKAAKMLFGGLGVVGAQESGLFDSAPANASGLSAEQQKRKADLQRDVAAGNWKNAVGRRSIEEELKGLQTLELDLMKQSGSAAIAQKSREQQEELERKAREQRQKDAEYSTAVDDATSARDMERKRDTRWSDTRIGKYYNETGGTPTWALAFGAGAGVLDRLAKGAPKTRGDYARLGAEGSFSAAIPINAPLAYNAFSTEPDNPEWRAIQAYAQKLPQTHPEKQHWQSYADKLGRANPVREAAQNEFYDPLKFMKRLGMAAIEGGFGAVTGSNIPGAINAIGRGASGAIGQATETAGSLPGRFMTGHNTQMGRATTARAVSEDSAAAALDLQKSAAEAQRRSGAPASGSQPAPAAGGGLFDPAPAGPQHIPHQQSGGVFGPSPTAPQQPIQGLTGGIGNQELVIPKGVKPIAEWERNSARARMAAEEHLVRTPGAHLAPARGASKDPGTLRAQDLHDQLNNPSHKLPTTQAALKRLRDVMAANNIDPKTVTVEQLKDFFTRLDPKIFAVPLAAGVGAEVYRQNNSLFGGQ